MPGDSTSWTVIEGAAAGNAKDRDAFARRYGPAARAYLAARWQGAPLQRDVGDAVGEVFLGCSRQGGVLDRADRTRSAGFRAFFYGVIRNVALRVEERRGRAREVAASGRPDLETAEAAEDAHSKVFDRAWARAMLREAAERQGEVTRRKGRADSLRRLELLRLRFEEGLPIREIARLWDEELAAIQREYARARTEFKDALIEVMAWHQPGTAAEIERECAALLGLLG
jgi:RNA polymerase sigma-70 factor (ECF subfamily)